MIGFNKKLKGSTGSAEFDIVTPDTLMECKNRSWRTLSDDAINDIKSQIRRAENIANEFGKKYCVIFKGKTTPKFESWLAKKNITYLEL